MEGWAKNSKNWISFHLVKKTKGTNPYEGVKSNLQEHSLNSFLLSVSKTYMPFNLVYLPSQKTVKLSFNTHQLSLNIFTEVPFSFLLLGFGHMFWRRLCLKWFRIFFLDFFFSDGFCSPLRIFNRLFISLSADWIAALAAFSYQSNVFENRQNC